jgi:hypothetical protein
MLTSATTKATEVLAVLVMITLCSFRTPVVHLKPQAYHTLE